tara:strand:+ start:1439 stop:2002 length:564 start_codon:yes stop_codon:yes gene_type:complete
MRIISGNFRGKKILEPRDIITRPLKDLTKESIFNIINHSKKFNVEIKDANILDLFSGVGSFGLECLSRGANHLTFVENYRGVLPVLKKNLSSLNNFKKYEILEKDIFNGTYLKNINIKFDIIFLDPPYKYSGLEEILTNISDKKILNKDGIIIIHRHKKEKDKFPKNFKILEEKKYGISKIIFGNLN